MNDQSNINNVSVILPVFNGVHFLKECIESILNQSFSPDEIIVINDGSTDASQEIIDSYPEIINIKTDNQGVAAARNTGIKLAKGNWITFIDQDDIWTKDSLKSRMNFLQKNPETLIVTGKQKWFLDGIDEIPSWVKPEQMKDNLEGYLLGCTLVRKDLFNKYDLFDTSFRYSSDFDWFFRLKDNYVLFHQIDDLVLKKRIHATNESRNSEALLKELSRAIYNSIKRKGQNSN